MDSIAYWIKYRTQWPEGWSSWKYSQFPTSDVSGYGGLDGYVEAELIGSLRYDTGFRSFEYLVIPEDELPDDDRIALINVYIEDAQYLMKRAQHCQEVAKRLAWIQ